MTLEQASNFLVVSILASLGFIILVSAAIVINNMIHKYWKSFGWKFFPMYVEKEEVVKEEPTLTKK